MRFILFNTETKQTLFFNSFEVLELINRDRSEDWQNYNLSDFIEGLEEWTEYKFLGFKEGV